MSAEDNLSAEDLYFGRFKWTEESFFKACPIPWAYLNQLLDLGLWFSSPIACFNGGVWIAKPKTTPGNNFDDFKPGGIITLGEIDVPWLLPQPESDAAMVAFYKHKHVDKWIVNAVDCAGGLGPADFVDIWDTPEEALADIKDFYFGDPARMNLKNAEHLESARRLARAKREGLIPDWPRDKT